MPSSSRFTRTASPTRSRSTSYSGATQGRQQLPNVVKRLAIEGKTERSPNGRSDGASVKMYLRIALPANELAPGSIVPLFEEGKWKILHSQVHPLNQDSVPYNFSNVSSPLLRKACRALNLSARLSESYMSLFGSNASSSSSVGSAAPLENRYTGYIDVHDYFVSLVLPKEFPSRTANSSGGTSRRVSSPEVQFVAAIDMWIPFATKPPLSPYLLSLPIPRCLSNHIRLRIFPPATSNNLSSSLASLSSAEGEANTWDLTSEPHVTRSPSKRLSRTSSYQNFADDESSDSSTTGFSDGYGIQGSFPSTNRMRVRWATPMKSSDVPETSDGRRRVAIREVMSDMTCVILDRSESKGKGRGRGYGDDVDGGEEGVIMKVDYTATCQGVWFPGVATMLGMDVSLDAGDCVVAWAPGEEQKWTVSGGTGFTGFAVGPPPNSNPSRQPTADTPGVFLLPATPTSQAKEHRANGHIPHSSSSASLLRAPLPAQNDDYSFDESPNATPLSSTTPLSSIASLTTLSSSPERKRSRSSSVNIRADGDQDGADVIRHPKIPISVHLNMNELDPTQDNIFTFTISGIIMVTPVDNPFLLSSERSNLRDSDLMSLPQFHVLFAKNETISTLVRNEMEDSILDIYNVTGKISDPQSRKTVLQPGGQTKCSSDGARIAVRAMTSPSSFSYRSRRDASVDSVRRPGSRPRTPSGASRQMSTPMRQTLLMSTPRPKRDGPLMIPRVHAKITPFVSVEVGQPHEYAVRILLPAPSDSDSEWLEFGLAQPSEPAATKADASKKQPLNGHAKTGEESPPHVQIASASYEGVPVRFETSTTTKPDDKLPALGLTFEETSTKEWMTWVKVHIGEMGGGNLEVVYLVKTNQFMPRKVTSAKTKPAMSMNILLPTFSLPVGVMDVFIEAQTEFELLSLQHNFSQQRVLADGRTLTRYSLEEYFYPSLALAFTPILPRPATSPTSSSNMPHFWSALAAIVCAMSTAMAVHVMTANQAIQAELAESQHALLLSQIALQACSTQVYDYATIDPETITVTSTITTTIHASAPTQHKRWQRPNPPTSEDFVNVQLTPSGSGSTTTATQSPSPTAMPTLTIAAETPTQASAVATLTPLIDFSLFWPLSIASIEVPPSARNTVKVVMRGAAVAWRLFLKAYHYPANPP